MSATIPSDPPTAASYTYDALGRRVSKTVSATTTAGVIATTTIFVSDGLQEIAEYESVAGAVPILTRSYIYGSYIDEPLCMSDFSATPQSPSRYYYHANDIYSVSAITNSTGAVVERYKYDPYGKATILASDGATPRAQSLYGNPWTFTGRRLDNETGLMYYRARMYSTEQGRFISRDPITRKAHESMYYPEAGMGYYQTYCLYEYCKGRPIRRVDPSGLWGEGTHGQTSGTATSPNQGHSDFPGSQDMGGIFDYNLEDTGWSRPENPASTDRHFRSLDDSEKDLVNDVKECNKEGFERHAHQMQDFFSHYGQGFRSRSWALGFGVLGVLAWGHAASTAWNEYGPGRGPRPDNADDFRAAFNEAIKRTQDWVDRWNKCCCCDKEKKCKKKEGRSEKECAAPAPKNPFGENAPPGKRVK